MVETHLNNLDDEMINLLKTVGLELFYVGVESSSHVVLKDMKRFTVEHDKQYKVIKKCEDAGIKVKTMFIIGNPEDTKDTIIPNQLNILNIYQAYIHNLAYLLLILAHLFIMSLKI